MPKRLSNFDRQIRYYALNCIAADLKEAGLLNLREYYQILSLISHRYLDKKNDNDRDDGT